MQAKKIMEPDGTPPGIESDQRFRGFADSAPAMLWVTEPDGRCTFLSRGWYEFTGQAEAEALGFGWLDALHPEDREQAGRAFAESNERHELFQCEYRFRRADGAYRWGIDVGRPRFSPGGEYLGYVGSVIDIHDRKHAEEETRRLDERRRLALESAQLGSWNMDPSTGDLQTDERFRAIFGFVGDQFPFPDAISLIHPEDRERVLAAVAASTRPESPLPYSLEHRVIHPDGSVRWVYARGRANLTGEGGERRLTSFDGTLADITDRKRDDQERERLLREVEAERERLADVFQRAPSFMCVLRGPEHVLERANDRYYQLVGHRDILGKPAREALPEVEGQGFFELLDQVYRTGEAFVGTDIPVLLQRNPGDPPERRSLDLVYQALRNSEGAITGILAQGIDLTDRKRAEQALRSSRERLELALNAAKMGTWELDLATGTMTCSRECKRNYGRPDGDAFTYEDLAASVHEDDRDMWRKAVEDSVGRSEGLDVEYRTRWQDGSIHWVLVRATCVTDATGRAVGMSGISLEITDRKRAEERTRLRAFQLQTLTNIATRVNSARDVDSVIGVVTEEARHLIGAHQAATTMVLNPQYAQPLNVLSASEKYPQGSNPPEMDSLSFYEALEEANGIIRLTRGQLDSDPRWCRLAKVASVNPTANGWLAAPLLGRDGRSMGVIQLADKYEGEFTHDDEAILSQLSNLTSIAIQNARLNQELKNNDERKNEFLAMLAHELRNPLAAISNAVKVALRFQAKEQIDWSFEVITRQMEHFSRLIDDLMDVSRITQGKIDLRRDDVELHTILKSAATTVGPLVEVRQHTLELELGDEPLWVNADSTRIEQVVVNLLNNAAKYSEDGGHVRLSARKEKGKVVIAVKDTGVGIPPEKMPEMFELFAQGDRSLARSEGGLGIGLTVVKKLVEMHGGTITALSEGHGKGSEFVIRLPVVKEPEQAARKVEGTLPVGKKSTILVVDDNVDTATGMARYLKLMGHDVFTAHSGPEALEVANRHGPEVILLDIGLPGMSGYEVASQLRKEACYKDAILIAISGYGQEEDRRQAKNAGFDHHLTKPLDLDNLLALLPA